MGVQITKDCFFGSLNDQDYRRFSFIMLSFNLLMLIVDQVALK